MKFDLKVFLTEFHYKKKYTAAEKLLAALLYLPSIAYGAITSIRNFLYKKNVLNGYKSSIYTVAVGNLTTGGTGKTPITAAIANYYAQKGEKPAILSRGYGGKLQNKEVNVVSDGKEIFFSAEEAGDEPFWLAENCKGTVVLTCSSRVKAAKYAEQMKKWGCTKLILDDGFQHQKLKRDLNILVVDSEKQFSNGQVLPLGALREPVSEISRADKIVVVNKTSDDKGAKAAKVFSYLLKKNQKKPVFVCKMVPDEVYNIKNSEKLCPSTSIFAFSAIAQPEQFYDFLTEFDLLGTKDFPDHHIYSREDLKELAELASKHEAGALVTTEKDAVKIRETVEDNGRIFALKLKQELDLEGLLNDTGN